MKGRWHRLSPREEWATAPLLSRAGELARTNPAPPARGARRELHAEIPGITARHPTSGAALGAVREIIEILRSRTRKDFGDDPRRWIEGLRADVVEGGKPGA